MKKKPESNPDPVARREALASDVERFLSSGKAIEQIPTGLSSYSPQGPVKSLRAQSDAKKPAAVAETAETVKSEETPVTAETAETEETADTVEVAAPTEEKAETSN